MKSIPRFHLAFPVHDLNEARTFYVDILGCNTGRESDTWIDFDLYGHQIVAHLSPGDCSPVATNPVDKDNIPCRHFGLILDWRKWEKLKNRIKKLNHGFLVEPKIRFKFKPGEQGTFFINDPSGNTLEFKTFKKDSMVFEKS
jgi:hypothetical protein